MSDTGAAAYRRDVAEYAATPAAERGKSEAFRRIQKRLSATFLRSLYPLPTDKIGDDGNFMDAARSAPVAAGKDRP